MDDALTVKELMVPLSEYAAVDRGATLFEAVVALEDVQSDQRGHGHKITRAVLVKDGKDIIGKVSYLDILRSLEPKYAQMGDTAALSRAGLSSEFIRTMLTTMDFCSATLSDMCGKAARIKVEDIMYTCGEGEMVTEDTPLCEAIHLMVMGQHQSILVTGGNKITGVLRPVDVFEKVADLMKACELTD